MTKGRASYAVLLALAALDAAGYGVIAPVVPEISDETGAGPALIGALVAAFAVGMAAGFVVGGAGVQRSSARAVLAGALAVLALGTLAFVAGGGLAVYCAGRVLQGLGSGGLWIGVTFGVLERFPTAAYTRLTGVLAAYSVGAVAGPALGAAGGVRAPFLLFFALVALAGAALPLVGRPAERPVFGSDRAVLAHPAFRAASVGVVLVALGYGTIDGPLPLHFADELGQGAIAGLYVVASLVVGASAVAAGRLSPRTALWLGLPLISVGVAAAGIGETVAVWAIAIAVAGVGLGLGEAGALGFLLEATGPERMVLAMVVWSQVWAVGYLAGPAVSGALAEALGFAAVGLLPLVALVLAAPLLVPARGFRRAEHSHNIRT